MNILILNGSPHRQGCVGTLLDCIAEGITANGRQTEWIDVYSLKLSPCIGCMKCRQGGECVLTEDDAHRIGRKIKSADGLVVGTPTHWANMSAPLKMLLDRNVPVFMGQRPSGIPEPCQTGKPAAIVTACTTSWPFNFLFHQSSGALRAVDEVLHQGGYRILGKLVMPGTKRSPIVPKSLKTKAIRLGRKF